MRTVVVSLWALFAGLSLIVVGNGLQSTLLGVRASLSGFPTGVTGAVMACYYLGFMLGSWTTPRLIARVGPIRVFAALASLFSFAPLAHALFVDPVAWAVVRLLSDQQEYDRHLGREHLELLVRRRRTSGEHP